MKLSPSPPNAELKIITDYSKDALDAFKKYQGLDTNDVTYDELEIPNWVFIDYDLTWKHLYDMTREGRHYFRGNL